MVDICDRELLIHRTILKANEHNQNNIFVSNKLSSMKSPHFARSIIQLIINMISKNTWFWFVIIGAVIGLLLSPGQNGRDFADDIFKCIFVNEKFCISIRISLKFVPNGPVDIN